MRLKYIEEEIRTWSAEEAKKEDVWDVEDSDGDLIISDVNEECALLLVNEREEYIDTVWKLTNLIERIYEGKLPSHIFDEIFEILTKRGEKC